MISLNLNMEIHRMGELLLDWYPWVKAAHIISVISWMAGLLYLPRLFVYHADMSKEHINDVTILTRMEERLFHFIMQKAMMATWIFGILLILTPGVVDFSILSWFYIKLFMVILMTVCHVWLGRRQDDFEAGRNTLSSKNYRIINEVPTLLMVVIVIMVIVKPF